MYAYGQFLVFTLNKDIIFLLLDMYWNKSALSKLILKVKELEEKEDIKFVNCCFCKYTS